MKTYRLGRDKAHRKSLLRNLASDLVRHGRIKTTLAKAKAVRPMIERATTIARVGDDHARRQLARYFYSEEVISKLISEIAPRFRSRPGGYTRILKLGKREADGAEVALIEWVE